MLRHLFLIVPFLLLVHVTSAVALPACEGEDVLRWTNCTGAKSLGNGRHYTGEWRAGKYHGYGVFTHINGYKYAGQWENGKKHGKGVERTFDSILLSHWENNEIHGYTIFIRHQGALPVWGAVGFMEGHFRKFEGTRFDRNGTIRVGSFEFHQLVSGKSYTAGNAPSEIVSDWEKIKEKYLPELEKRGNGESTETSLDITPMDKAKLECEELGFTSGTEKYGNCVLRLMEMN